MSHVTLVEEGPIGPAGQESVPESGLQGAQRRGPGLEGLQELADLQIEGGVVAAVAVEGVLGADGAALEEHAGGVEVARQARVVERHRVPLVTRVHVHHARLQQVPEPIHVTRTRRLENVAVWDLLQRHRRREIRRL